MNSLSNKLCSRMRQNQGEDEEVHEREQRAHRRAREERLDAVMVADALHDVAHHLRVEETQRQLHQLDEEVRYERYVDAGIHVQQYPATDELHRQLRHRHH